MPRFNHNARINGKQGITGNLTVQGVLTMEQKIDLDGKFSPGFTGLAMRRIGDNNWGIYFTDNIQSNNSFAVGTPTNFGGITRATRFRCAAQSTQGFIWEAGTETGLMSLSGTGNLKLLGDLTVDSTTFHVDSANNNVGIGNTTPSTSTLLDLTSTTGALLLPRMTTTQKNALTGINGMLVYDLTLNKFQGYENGSWTSLI